MAEESKEGLKAKTVSLIGKIIGGSIILIGFILKAFNIWNVEVNDLIKIGFAEMAVFGTIDINIALDKFIKKGE
jgi:cbb3-type cytochrome oxidase subunit 1